MTLFMHREGFFFFVIVYYTRGQSLLHCVHLLKQKAKVEEGRFLSWPFKTARNVVPHLPLSQGLRDGGGRACMVHDESL
jgi:hypothetical protein